MDGLGLHACSLSHALSGTAGGCGKENVQSHLLEGCYDAVLGGCLASAGTARKYHDLVVDGGADGLGLKIIVGDAGLLTDGGDVGLFLEHLLLSGGEQCHEFVGGADLTEIERWQVDGLVLCLQVLGGNHLVKGRLDGGFVGFQKLYSCFHELVAMGINMAFVGKLVEGVEDSASAPPLVILTVTHLSGDGVGGLEADAPDVVGKAIGIGLHLVDALLAVGLVNLCGVGGTDSIALEKDHHVLDVELLHPRVVDLLDALGSDAVHLAKPLAVMLDDVEGIHAELGYDELGVLWTDTLDESAAEVFLQSEERGRHGFLIGLNNELATV